MDSSRLSMYPPFKNLISLSIQTPQYDDSSLSNSISWLNGDRFPSLKFLDIPMTDKVTGDQLYESLKTIDNVSALSIRFGKYSSHHRSSKIVWDISLRIPSSVKLLMLDHWQQDISLYATLDLLDLSECNNLIGIKSTVEIGYSKIEWPDDGHSLQFINFTFKEDEWYEVKRNDIPCDILMGDCFPDYFGYNACDEASLWIKGIKSEQLIKYHDMHSDDDNDSIFKFGWMKEFYKYFDINHHAIRWIKHACDSKSFCREYKQLEERYESCDTYRLLL